MQGDSKCVSDCVSVCLSPLLSEITFHPNDRLQPNCQGQPKSSQSNFQRQARTPKGLFCQIYLISGFWNRGTCQTFSGTKMKRSKLIPARKALYSFLSSLNFYHCANCGRLFALSKLELPDKCRAKISSNS